MEGFLLLKFHCVPVRQQH